jgi:serine protease Do
MRLGRSLLSLVLIGSLSLWADRIEEVPTAIPHSLSPMVQTRAESVVYLMTSDDKAGAASPFIDDPWFRPYLQFPQLGLTSQKLRRSLGSGVMIDSKGLIVTSAHFVQDRKSVKVQVPNRHEIFDAQVLGVDTSADLALLRIISDQPFEAVEFAEAEQLKAGDLLFAIGNPFGLEPVVSMGVVSTTGLRSAGAFRMLQSDLFLHGGNIGGVVINTRGEMAGMPVRLKGSRSHQSHGGFFLPIDQVRDIAYRLERSGSVKEAWLGIAVADLSQEMKSYFGREEGVLVTAVEPSSPAEQAGLRRGDLIIMADDVIVDSLLSFERILSTLVADRDIALLFLREKRIREASLRVGRLEGLATRSARTLYHHGMVLESLTHEWQQRLALNDITRGAVVTSVEPGSRADRSGFNAGDVVVSADSLEVGSLAEFQALSKGRSLRRFTVLRGGLILGLDLIE